MPWVYFLHEDGRPPRFCWYSCPSTQTSFVLGSVLNPCGLILKKLKTCHCPSERRNRRPSSIIWPPPAATEPANQFRSKPRERDSCKGEKYDHMHSLREELEHWKAKYEEAVRDGQEMDAKSKTLYIPVGSSGDDCPPPPPLKQFSDGGLDSIVARNIKLSGYDRPTPLQQHVIPIIKGGRDLVVMCSQTGSGTRAAFFVPIISAMHKNPPSDGYGYGRYSDRGYTRRSIIKPRALVLAPCRELAVQICEEAKKVNIFMILTQYFPDLMLILLTPHNSHTHLSQPTQLTHTSPFSHSSFSSLTMAP